MLNLGYSFLWLLLWLLWLRRYRVHIFIEVDVVERLVVNAQRVVLNAREQDELLLISDTKVRHGLGWHGQAIEKFIGLNIPNFHIFLADSENVFCVLLIESHMRN